MKALKCLRRLVVGLVLLSTPSAFAEPPPENSSPTKKLKIDEYSEAYIAAVESSGPGVWEILAVGGSAAFVSAPIGVFAAGVVHATVGSALGREGADDLQVSILPFTIGALTLTVISTAAAALSAAVLAEPPGSSLYVGLGTLLGCVFAPIAFMGTWTVLSSVAGTSGLLVTPLLPQLNEEQLFAVNLGALIIIGTATLAASAASPAVGAVAGLYVPHMLEDFEEE